MLIGFVLILTIFSLVGVSFWSWLRFKADGKEGRFSSSIYAFLIAILLITAIWLAAWLLIPLKYGGPTGPGVAGDMFGIVTSLFSGLAFAGLVSTLLMQRQELKHQRDELRLTRREFSTQRFENTLFSIMDLFVNHVSRIEYKIGVEDDFFGETPAETLQGKAALEFCASELPDDFSETIGMETMLDDSKENHLRIQIQAYEDLYFIDYGAFLGPYFRLLYHAIRHIEKSELSEDDKLRYSKVVRAHLSSAEVKILLFNGLSKEGTGFKHWIEKHSLLKHLSPDDFENNKYLVESYADQAFG